ncbi:trihelix transcription factor ASIL2 [Solanum pennellii]|uniref:Trihelix transcription factor ASIL2 n=1 Tax=Solanum pennellii TaxID=28526 RepID=A0ABM1FQ06_SOLPN|nr:trihelix transcription factor ASIL2 [Solanum pennellii]
MATFSPSTQDFSTTPSQILSSSNVTVAVPSRRLPPPCWSHDETIALIDAYRDKWYSLRKGNLRANHWQEVAEDVGSRCPVDPPKTAVQCRHKMEKLRKRYRAEIQRAAPYGGARSHRYCSAWVHFKRMDMMERGPNAVSPPPSEDEADEDVEDYHQNGVKLVGDLYGNNVHTGNRSSFQGVVSNGGGGFRIRIPGMPGLAPPMAKPYSRFEEARVETPSNFGSSQMFRDGFVKKADLGKRVVGEGVREKKKEDPMVEMVAAIKVLGDGFVRMERMKMDAARELERMRMEMEMKRTEMILESQQRVVEAFAQALSEEKYKKAKRVPTPEC